VKDFPRYTSIKYYYSDKTTSNTFLFGTYAGDSARKLIGSLVLTEDGVIYLHLHRGYIITPDELRDDRCVTMEWITQRAIKYAIDFQPYDLKDWCELKGNGMYSKDFWHTTYKDIREFKIKLALGEFQPSEKWIG
jgi:hypothetical protein